MIVTISTVGYGDFKPTNDETRIFSIFWMTIGVVYVFSSINYGAQFVIGFIEEHTLEIVLEEQKNIGVYVHRVKLALSLLGIVSITLFGTVFYMANESFDFITALYWCVETITTVGYGDLTTLQVHTFLHPRTPLTLRSLSHFLLSLSLSLSLSLFLSFSHTHAHISFRPSKHYSTGLDQSLCYFLHRHWCHRYCSVHWQPPTASIRRRRGNEKTRVIEKTFYRQNVARDGL